eukprot:jgi/Mesvir1/20645/Mv14866-RA.1
MVYPLGSTVVIREKGNPKRQEFLQGHTDTISCLAMSTSGRFLASGQVTYMGFAADIIIWDMESLTMLHRMSLHKVKVQALSFSFDDCFLASLGGQDDNNLVVWDVETGKAVCGSPTLSDNVWALKFCNTRSDQLVTCGSNSLHVWDFDANNRKVRPAACQLGQLKRENTSLVIDPQDEYAYVSTHTGDVMKVSLHNKLFKNLGPTNRISLGILSSARTPSGDVLVGGGDGSLTIISSNTLKVVAKCAPLVGGVTSVVVTNQVSKDGSFTFFAGTKQCNVYYGSYSAASNEIAVELVQTCHHDVINDIVFPDGYSEVFATAAAGEIRIWNAYECRELLRIQVPNVECICVAFAVDGGSILSGWSDGKIRAFGPQSGRLLYTIHDAHPQGVTSIVGTSDSQRVISGGREGMVRVWKVGKQSQPMLASMKEHKGPINSITVRKNDAECVSASSDGSCIIWDLKRFARNNSLFASTFFKAVQYHPDDSQLLTTGTDRKITYWDVYDGQAIRIMDGSMSHELNALDISSDGEGFVSGGGDKDVRLWSYDEGHCDYVGRGHSGAITKVKISPDQAKIVSVGAEGAVFMWNYQRPGFAADGDH